MLGRESELFVPAIKTKRIIPEPILSYANSSWKCNETFFEKYFVRSAIAKGLAGTIV